MIPKAKKAMEVAKKTTQATEKLSDTKKQLEGMQKHVDTVSKIGDQLKKAAKELKEGDKKKAMKTLGGAAVLAALSYLAPEKKDKKEEKGVAVTEVNQEAANDNSEEGETEYGATIDEEEFIEEKAAEIDPSLVEKVDGLSPKCTQSKNKGKILEDHTHNAKIVELLPNKEGKLNDFLKKYKENKHRYEKVAKAVHIPAMLIAAKHYMEASMNFNGYLHNGQRLGSPTTYVPKGILFDSGQWEEAAIHALGGDIKDKNGRPSSKYMQNLRMKFGVDENTKDMGKLLTMAESYNGLGYRGRGRQSSYIYAGTNLMTRGRYVADGKFDGNKLSNRIGVAAIIMGIESEEAGKPIRVASSNKLLMEYGNQRKSRTPRKLASGATILSQGENNKEIGKQAKRILGETKGKPYGTEVPFEENGVKYIARVETHDDKGKGKNRGKHRGITVYKAAA